MSFKQIIDAFFESCMVVGLSDLLQQQIPAKYHVGKHLLPAKLDSSLW